MEEMVQNTILIDDDKKIKSEDHQNEDIFEKIFDEIKENYKSVDGEEAQEVKEDNKNIKEEKKEDGQKKEEIKKKEVKKNAKTDVGSFEILNNEDYENVQNQNKETDSDKDDW